MHRRSEIDWSLSSMTPKAVPAAPLGLLAKHGAPPAISSHGRRSGWSCPRTGKTPYLVRAPNKVADQKQRRAHGLAKWGGALAPSNLLDAHE